MMIEKEINIKHIKSNMKEFFNANPFFYDKQKIFWLWDNYLYKWYITDEIDLLNSFEEFFDCEFMFTRQGEKIKHIDAFKLKGRKSNPKEVPKKWIQFKNKVFSLNSNKLYDVKSNYFFNNPIPWEIGKSTKTPVMDKLFEDWVGKDHVKTLYEIIAYCCYRGYPIQTLFCLFGGGRNGKSCFIDVINRFLGEGNVCSSDLDMLVGFGKSRFESFKMYKKLACFMGETNFNKMESTSMIKKLVGGDLISFEMKGKNPFDDKNYAKMIIASNSLPKSDDTSDGWYRRWLIVDFPNQFEEGKDIVKTIPKKEYENLAKKVIGIIPKLISNGCFTNGGSFEERKSRYIDCSNPIGKFLERFTENDPKGYVKFNVLFNEYNLFLRKRNQRVLSRKEFSLIIQEEGLHSDRTSHENESTFFVHGINFKKMWKEETEFK